MDLFSLLVSTVILRYYVFLFLLLFLVAGVVTLGLRKTAIFLGITWCIAFLAEYSSTRNGIPFGDYFYIESTRHRELWISNIPFMDSISFTFLAYVSYTMALFFLLKPFRDEGWGLQDEEDIRHSPKVLGLAVLLFVFLDVVIDPLALRGDRWFLGKIFGYGTEGVYFGVPISNFVGWAVVGGSSLFLFQCYDEREKGNAELWRVSLGRLLLGPLLYFIILLFNLSMTLVIGERLLGTVGIFIHLPILVFFLLRLAALRRVSPQLFEEKSKSRDAAAIEGLPLIDSKISR